MLYWALFSVSVSGQSVGRINVACLSLSWCWRKFNNNKRRVLQFFVKKKYINSKSKHETKSASHHSLSRVKWLNSSFRYWVTNVSWVTVSKRLHFENVLLDFPTRLFSFCDLSLGRCRRHFMSNNLHAAPRRLRGNWTRSSWKPLCHRLTF